MQDKGIQSRNDFRIGVVASRFNSTITEKLVTGALDRLRERGISSQQVSLIWVPGAIELPLAAQQMARKNCFDAILVLGAVIQGETDHYQYVCQSVTMGCQKVALESNLPVIFGVLTTQTIELAEARVGGNAGHKGREAVDAAIEMIAALRSLDQPKE